eukprot:Selendium_serpulae@DN3900_c0_g1_i1.p1
MKDESLLRLFSVLKGTQLRRQCAVLTLRGPWTGGRNSAPKTSPSYVMKCLTGLPLAGSSVQWASQEAKIKRLAPLVRTINLSSVVRVFGKFVYHFDVHSKTSQMSV